MIAIPADTKEEAKKVVEEMPFKERDGVYSVCGPTLTRPQWFGSVIVQAGRGKIC